jgi:hypothetical protein
MITQHTVEENILRKANQKRHLEQLVLTEGQFTTDHFFQKLTISDLLQVSFSFPCMSIGLRGRGAWRDASSTSSSSSLTLVYFLFEAQ